MQRENAGDSEEDALTYLNTIIDDVGPASSKERRMAFVRNLHDSVSTLEKYGVKWFRSKNYPDYFSHKAGGRQGRCLEVKPFNVRRLGDWCAKTRADETIPLPLVLDDFSDLARGLSTLKAIIRIGKVAGRKILGDITGRKLRGMGVSLACSLMYIVRNKGVPIWLNAPLTKLIFDKGAIIGAVVLKDGQKVRVRARKGVILGAGGFAHNREWRQKYHGFPGWSATAPGDNGSGIQLGLDAGADSALFNLGWWVPVIPFPGDHSRGMLLIWERSMPHSIVIDQNGKRFVNESIPYVEFIQAVIDQNKLSPNSPAWIVADRSHKKYFNLASTVGIEKLKVVGTIVDAPTLQELAKKIGVPPENLLATVDRFNIFARAGVDKDFHRGENEYEKFYGDPVGRRNPNLGELRTGPFRALKVMPGDIGTKGGLLTDEYARVLDKNGKPIDGLYAAGNTTATVMGQTYPGPGGSLGPALVFGFAGARHAAERAA